MQAHLKVSIINFAIFSIHHQLITCVLFEAFILGQCSEYDCGGVCLLPHADARHTAPFQIDLIVQ